MIARWCVQRAESDMEDNDEVGLKTYVRSPDGRALHRCQDSGEVKGITGAPVPVNVPGDFTVRLGDVIPAWVMTLYTLCSRTRRAISWVYWLPKSTTAIVSGFISYQTTSAWPGRGGFKPALPARPVRLPECRTGPRDSGVSGVARLLGSIRRLP